MVKHKEVKYSVYSPRQLYDLVINIEKYQEFLPWCSAARILKSKDNVIFGELVINFKGFHNKYISKVEHYISHDINAEHIIKVSLIEGPFEYLNNFWSFKFDQQKKQTEIIFEIDFCFNSKMLQKLMGLVFERALITMMSVFNKRAEEVYGVKN